MAARNDQMVRMLELMVYVQDLAIRGKRDPEHIAQILQTIKDNPDFLVTLSPSKIQPNNVVAQLKSWAKMYKEVFGIKKDFSDLKIPQHKPGFDRLIIVAKGLTLEQIFQAMKKLMPASKYLNDLDQITSIRNPDEDYAVWVRDRQEADEENRNISASQIKAEGTNPITLPERLLYEIKYFLETGNHLDIHNWTLCAGSRFPCGFVPCAFWSTSDVGVCVGWCDPGSADGYFRIRAAVS